MAFIDGYFYFDKWQYLVICLVQDDDFYFDICDWLVSFCCGCRLAAHYPACCRSGTLRTTRR